MSTPSVIVRRWNGPEAETEYEHITIVVEGTTARCSNPCKFNQFQLRASLGSEGVICTGVDLTASTRVGKLPLKKTVFPLCGFPDTEGE